jgi:threonine/homoserine/homoserine lactone efflux protein
VSGTALAAYTLAALLVVLVPGLDSMLVLRSALLGGARSGIAVAVGIQLGCAIWGAASVGGLTALFVASHVAYQIVRWLGAAYLVWLGASALYRSWRGADALPEPTDRRPRGLRDGLATNLLNPKMIAFYLSLLPQFVPAGAAVGWSVLLVAIHIALGFTWSLLLVGLAGWAGAFFRRPAVRRWLNRVTASVLVALGVRMAVAQGG